MNKGFTAKSAAFCLALCLLTVTVCDLVLPEGEGVVYDSVIRLHILANSSSAEDISIKYAVRDAVLAADCFEGAADIIEAKGSIEEAAKKAVNAANAYLKKKGVPYRATYRWGHEDYPTREYEGLRLPSGDYLSLRIVLGEGDGENWWCVLFPPMCLGAAKDSLDIKGKEVFDTKDKKYSFRFKLLEWFS